MTPFLRKPFVRGNAAIEEYFCPQPIDLLIGRSGFKKQVFALR
jgi:hypothetical protein